MATVLHKPDEARIRAGILGAATLQINHSSGVNPEQKRGLTVICCINPSHLQCKYKCMVWNVFHPAADLCEVKRERRQGWKLKTEIKLH